MNSNTSSISNFGTYEKTSYQLPLNTDLNTLIYSGIYMGSGLVNAPMGLNHWFHIEVMRHKDDWTVQKAYPLTNPVCPVYIRTQIDGNWNEWRLFNPGTANTAQVLSGYTFSSANGVNLSGTLIPVVNSLTTTLYPPYSYTYTVSTEGYYVFIVCGMVRYNSSYTGTTFYITKNGNTISPKHQYSHTAYESGGGAGYVSDVVKCYSGDIIQLNASGDHYKDSPTGSEVYFGYVRV